MLQLLPRTLIVVACIWIISDSLFGFENSWILFLARVFSPLLLIVSISALSLRFLWQYRRQHRKPYFPNLIQTLIVLACAAPTVSSLITNSRYPSFSINTTSQHPPFLLLSANILGFEDLSTNLLREIEQHDPDIVALQEVNPVLAQTLRTKLASTFPCQVLDPDEGSRGMGIVSKFPCSSVPVSHAGNWVGRPQLLTIEIAPEKKVIIANIHAIHPHAFLRPDPRDGPSPITGLSQTVLAREQAIEEVLQAAKTTGESAIIIAGDLNATMRNSVYRRIRSAGYYDSWLRHNSFLSGGTWPSPGHAPMRLLGWLLRIDFVFHSNGLQVKKAFPISASLGSDHRALLVEFDVL